MQLTDRGITLTQVILCSIKIQKHFFHSSRSSNFCQKVSSFAYLRFAFFTWQCSHWQMKISPHPCQLCNTLHDAISQHFIIAFDVMLHSLRLCLCSLMTGFICFVIMCYVLHNKTFNLDLFRRSFQWWASYVMSHHTSDFKILCAHKLSTKYVYFYKLETYRQQRYQSFFFHFLHPVFLS